jgi:transcriptional regulator with XRE-family HTH domain
MTKALILLAKLDYFLLMSNSIGGKIKKIRVLKGFSQEYVANELHLTQRAYSKLEQNETALTWDKLVRLGEVFEISPSDLITFDDNFVLNNCTQSGKNNTINNYLSQELIESFQSRIKHLEEEVAFLRTMASKTQK